MPLYEYKCKRCSHVVEIMHGINDKPVRECPECGGELKKLISQSSFHLKGSGWYATDYKNKTKPDCSNSKSCKTCCTGA
jgi:putative FmdB family regulatory protein